MPTLNTAPPGKLWGTQGPRPDTDLGEPDPDIGGYHIGLTTPGWVLPAPTLPSFDDRLAAALGSFAEAPPEQLRHRLGLVVEATLRAILDRVQRASRRGQDPGHPTQRDVCSEAFALMAQARPGGGPMLVRMILEAPEDAEPTRRLLGILTDHDIRNKPNVVLGRIQALVNETRDPFVGGLVPHIPHATHTAVHRSRERLARLDRLASTRAKASEHIRARAGAIGKAAGGEPALANSILIARRLTGVAQVDPRTSQADAVEVELASVRRDLASIEGLEVPPAVLAELRGRESELSALAAGLRKAAKDDAEAGILATIAGVKAGELADFRTLLGDLLAIPGAFADAVRSAIADADPLPSLAWAVVADASDDVEGLCHCPRE